MPANASRKSAHRRHQSDARGCKHGTASNNIDVDANSEHNSNLTYRSCPQVSSVPETMRRQLDGKLSERQVARFEHHVFRCSDCQRAWLAAFDSEFESDAAKEGDFGRQSVTRKAA